MSCDPISVPDTPADIDVHGEILGFVLPDTVQVNSEVVVQISTVNPCGVVSTRVAQFDDTTGTGITRVFVPFFHVDPGGSCPDQGTTTSVAESLAYSSVGVQTVAASGDETRGELGFYTQNVLVVPSFTHAPVFHLHFQFLDERGNPRPSYPTSMHFTNRPGVSSDPFPIVADDSGIWDTTFTDTIGSIHYTIATAHFTARRGITENGMIIQ